MAVEDPHYVYVWVCPCVCVDTRARNPKCAAPTPHCQSISKVRHRQLGEGRAKCLSHDPDGIIFCMFLWCLQPSTGVLHRSAQTSVRNGGLTCTFEPSHLTRGKRDSSSARSPMSSHGVLMHLHTTTSSLHRQGPALVLFSAPMWVQQEKILSKQRGIRFRGVTTSPAALAAAALPFGSA